MQNKVSYIYFQWKIDPKMKINFNLSSEYLAQIDTVTGLLYVMTFLFFVLYDFET